MYAAVNKGWMMLRAIAVKTVMRSTNGNANVANG
jgi:hypothetical protein